MRLNWKTWKDGEWTYTTGNHPMETNTVLAWPSRDKEGELVYDRDILEKEGKLYFFRSADIVDTEGRRVFMYYKDKDKNTGIKNFKIVGHEYSHPDLMKQFENVDISAKTGHKPPFYEEIPDF